MTDPANGPDMPTLRAEIDALDKELVRLLKRRADHIDRAIEIKRAAGLPARIPARVEEVVTHVRDEADRSALDPDLVERLWRELIDWSIAREAQRIDLD